MEAEQPSSRALEGCSAFMKLLVASRRHRKAVSDNLATRFTNDWLLGLKSGFLARTAEEVGCARMKVRHAAVDRVGRKPCRKTDLTLFVTKRQIRVTYGYRYSFL